MPVREIISDFHTHAVHFGLTILLIAFYTNTRAQINSANASSVHNYGTGFRYLIARKFKLRTGIDVAWSNEDFGWYIVFGSMWNDQN